MAVSTPGAGIPIGVYRGRGCGISAIGVYENFIGRQVHKVVDFMVERPASWAQFENGNLTSTADVSGWQGVLGQRQLALGVPACCGVSAGSGGRTWAEEANGVNDTHWQALGNRLIGVRQQAPFSMVRRLEALRSAAIAGAKSVRESMRQRSR